MKTKNEDQFAKQVCNRRVKKFQEQKFWKNHGFMQLMKLRNRKEKKQCIKFVDMLKESMTCNIFIWIKVSGKQQDCIMKMQTESFWNVPHKLKENKSNCGGDPVLGPYYLGSWFKSLFAPI